MSTFEQLKQIAEAVRADRVAKRAPNPFAHKELIVPSSVSERQIPVHIYEPEGIKEDQAGPVVINFHGSGFVIPSLGQNAPWCARTSRRLGIRVVDSDYAKAPEDPFPACWQDGADVIRWTLAQPWCSGKVMLNGWSAGGAITIGFTAPSIAKKYGLSDKEIEAIQGGTAFYPPSGSDNDARLAGKNVKSQEWLDQNGVPGIGFTKQTLDFFNACYLLGHDVSVAGRLPEVSNNSVSHPAAVFSKPLTIVTAEYDTLHEEAERFAEALRTDGHPDVAFYVAKETSHGWESRITQNEAEWTEATKGGMGTKAAFDLVQDRIKKGLGL